MNKIIVNINISQQNLFEYNSKLNLAISDFRIVDHLKI